MDLSQQNLIFAFTLTLVAGLSTGLGSTLAFFTKATNKKQLAGALGLSAGVMIYVAMIEMFATARSELASVTGPSQGYLLTTICFFAGIAVIALIDFLVPDLTNPHELKDESDLANVSPADLSLLRMSLLTSLAVAIHNFPEGIATFTSALEDPTLGISIAIAIAIHNIPEGIAISIPVYCATGNRRKAFLLSLFSGLAEPLGAVLAYLLLRQYHSDMMLGIVTAAVAGIMVFISLDELLPTAEKYGEHHVAMGGLIAGMVLMAFGLVLFA